MAGDSKNSATALCCYDQKCCRKAARDKELPMQAIAGERRKTMPSKFLQAVDQAVVG
jgi:hypothetical protein